MPSSLPCSVMLSSTLFHPTPATIGAVPLPATEDAPSMPFSPPSVMHDLIAFPLPLPPRLQTTVLHCSSFIAFEPSGEGRKGGQHRRANGLTPVTRSAPPLVNHRTTTSPSCATKSGFLNGLAKSYCGSIQPPSLPAPPSVTAPSQALPFSPPECAE